MTNESKYDVVYVAKRLTNPDQDVPFTLIHTFYDGDGRDDICASSHYSFDQIARYLKFAWKRKQNVDIKLVNGMPDDEVKRKASLDNMEATQLDNATLESLVERANIKI